MKPTLMFSMLLALPVFAGNTVREAPAAADSCLLTWFAGGSVGYLTSLDTAMYNIHIGVTDRCWDLLGCNVSVFAEVGYTDKNPSFGSNWNAQTIHNPPGLLDSNRLSLNQLGSLLQYVADVNGAPILGLSNTSTSYDLDIVPITLNVKLERALTDNLNAYFGLGMGAADLGLDVNFGGLVGSASDRAWVFTGQVFGGLGYNVTPNWEIYGGARWIYYPDAKFSGSVNYGINGSLKIKMKDDCLLELGARYKF